MHELGLINDLLKKIESIAGSNGSKKVIAAEVRLGALCHISADHFREHFVQETKGTLADGAVLRIETCDDIHDPQAQDILLLSVDVEDEES